MRLRTVRRVFLSYVSAAIVLLAGASVANGVAAPATGMFPRAEPLVANDPGVARYPGERDGKPMYRVRSAAGAGTVVDVRPIVGTVGPNARALALVGLDAGGRNGYGVFLAYVAGRPRHVAAIPGGVTAAFADGGVVVFAKTDDPTSPDCCPRTYRATTFAWRNETLIRTGTRTVPANALRKMRAVRAPRFVRHSGALAASAASAWLEHAWVGRCFPDFVAAMEGTAGGTPLEPKPRGRFSGGMWTASFETGRLPAFLEAAVVDADYVPDGTLRRVLALAADPARRTIVFARIGPEESFGGYVRAMPAVTPRLPTIDATVARAAVPLAVSAAPPGPRLAELIAALGRPTASREACGDREVAYASLGDTPTTAIAIFDASGSPLAFGFERATGGG